MRYESKACWSKVSYATKGTSGVVFKGTMKLHGGTVAVAVKELKTLDDINSLYELQHEALMMRFSLFQ